MCVCSFICEEVKKKERTHGTTSEHSLSSQDTLEGGNTLKKLQGYSVDYISVFFLGFSKFKQGEAVHN